MPKLTVIVPLYNAEKYIKECIESIQNQSLNDIEIVIVDDGSDDNGLQICYELTKNDSRVRIIHQKNKGLAGARFTGIKNSTTEYVTFVDADDFILEQSYIYANEYMDKGIDMIFFEICRYFDKHNRKYEFHSLQTGYYDRERIEREVYPQLIWNFEKNTPGVECSQCVRIIKRELVLKMYESLQGAFYYGDDISITYPLYKKINSMQVISQCYYMHRQRTSECASYIKADKFFDETYNLYKYLLKEFCTLEYEEMFRKQIEYFFMYSVNLKRMKYNDVPDVERFLFPFDKIPYMKRILLYGAGEKGKVFYRQIKRLNYYAEILWVDKNAKYMADDNIRPITEIRNYLFDYVVIAIENKRSCESVKEFLVQQGIKPQNIVF